MTSTSATDFDLLIAGAGMVGATLAAALTGNGLRIGILDRHPVPAGVCPWQRPQPAFDLRVSAIAPASRDFLAAIDVWPGVVGARFKPYTCMRVWDADGTGAIEFAAGDVHQDALGFIVENSVLLSALHARLGQATDITVLTPETVEERTVEPVTGGGGNHTVLRLGSGRSVSTTLLVGADGPDSPVRRLAGLRTRAWDYPHTAIVATVETGKDHENTAWQRFLTRGPLAFLPLAGPEHAPQRYCSIVWSTLHDEADALMQLSDDAFADRLAKALENRLGQVRLVGPRAHFPLRQCHARDYVGEGVVLVGDAAHTIHPLAGQGVNLGFQDVLALSRALLANGQSGRPLNDPVMLHRYQRERVAHNLAMMAAMEGLQRLFAQEALPIRWLRNEGLTRINRLPWLKQQLIRQASGY